MPRSLFIIFLNFNFFMTVSYIPFVEAFFESSEITYLNRQFFLSMFLRVFQCLLRMPVNVSQWPMDTENFHNSPSNYLCDCVFYLSKSLMVIAYVSYTVLFKDIVNLTLVFAFFFFFAVFKKKVNIINITQDVSFIGIFYLHSCRTSGIASVYYS